LRGINRRAGQPESALHRSTSFDNILLAARFKNRGILVVHRLEYLGLGGTHGGARPGYKGGVRRLDNRRGPGMAGLLPGCSAALQDINFLVTVVF
jgi:hypothetical protein